MIRSTNNVLSSQPIGPLVSHTSKKATIANRRKAVLGSSRGKHTVLAQLSPLLIHIRLVPILIGCLFRVTKKLRVIIDDIALKFPGKNDSCNVSRETSAGETLFLRRNNIPYMRHLPEDFRVFS